MACRRVRLHVGPHCHREGRRPLRREASCPDDSAVGDDAVARLAMKSLSPPMHSSSRPTTPRVRSGPSRSSARSFSVPRYVTILGRPCHWQDQHFLRTLSSGCCVPSRAGFPSGQGLTSAWRGPRPAAHARIASSRQTLPIRTADPSTSPGILGRRSTWRAASRTSRPAVHQASGPMGRVGQCCAAGQMWRPNRGETDRAVFQNACYCRSVYFVISSATIAHGGTFPLHGDAGVQRLPSPRAAGGRPWMADTRR